MREFGGPRGRTADPGVQDHPLLASAIARILETELDLSVRGIFRTGAEAAAVALREQVAVVLVDFNLPDMSGPGAAVSILSAMPDVAIVFHSAEESEKALLDAIDAGATAFLTKAATAAGCRVHSTGAGCFEAAGRGAEYECHIATPRHRGAHHRVACEACDRELGAKRAPAV